jgi:hypothetical protein
MQKVNNLCILERSLFFSLENLNSRESIKKKTLSVGRYKTRDLVQITVPIDWAFLHNIEFDISCKRKVSSSRETRIVISGCNYFLKNLSLRTPTAADLALTQMMPAFSIFFNFTRRAHLLANQKQRDKWIR